MIGRSWEGEGGGKQNELGLWQFLLSPALADPRFPRQCRKHVGCVFSFELCILS